MGMGWDVGAGMSLPFDCPMDYLFELPRFFEEAGRTKKHLDFREPDFLNRLPPHLAASRHYVHVLPPNHPANQSPNTVLRDGQKVTSSQHTHTKIDLIVLKFLTFLYVIVVHRMHCFSTALKPYLRGIVNLMPCVGTYLE